MMWTEEAGPLARGGDPRRDRPGGGPGRARCGPATTPSTTSASPASSCSAAPCRTTCGRRRATTRSAAAAGTSPGTPRTTRWRSPTATICTATSSSTRRRSGGLANAPVPPFDFRLTLDSVRARRSTSYQAQAGDRFDFSPADEDLNALREALDDFYARVDRLNDGDRDTTRRRGGPRTIQRMLARILIPVNYAREGPLLAGPGRRTSRPLPDLALVKHLAAATGARTKQRAAQIEPAARAEPAALGAAAGAAGGRGRSGGRANERAAGDDARRRHPPPRRTGGPLLRGGAATRAGAGRGADPRPRDRRSTGSISGRGAGRRGRSSPGRSRTSRSSAAATAPAKWPRSGPGVTNVRPGDRVVLYPSLFCGVCDYCRAGEQTQCLDYRIFGEHTPGAMAEYAVAPAANLLPLPDHVDVHRGGGDAGGLHDRLADADHRRRAAARRVGPGRSASAAGSARPR